MNWLNIILILAVAFVLVFIEATFGLFRTLLGAQIDFLPALMVYAGLNAGYGGVLALAACGGLWFDSFSLNPFGLSILPLLLIGLLACRGREWLSSDDAVPQFCLGAVAGAVQPLLMVFLLLNLGHAPILGWKSLWQWLVMAVGCGVFTPVCFTLFRLIHSAFVYQPSRPTAFRQDRQIKRGRF